MYLKNILIALIKRDLKEFRKWERRWIDQAEYINSIIKLEN